MTVELRWMDCASYDDMRGCRRRDHRWSSVPTVMHQDQRWTELVLRGSGIIVAGATKNGPPYLLRREETRK